ncbi:MAG: 30S ribosomal protein S20 [Leptospiraceae bacterium]|nr:30S ribosomal protein S20 [Leptospiraceae bacterium]MCP5510572.1 30S ribosomal protein S20 [Leptospiraceae bacterium]
MANLRSSKKDIRRTEKRKARNSAQKSTIRTYAKNILKSIKAGNTEEAANMFNSYASLLDKAAKKSLIHKNNASRKKSRMAKKITALKAA